MAVPKKNQSNQRTRTRRANWKGSLQTLAKCPNCGATHRPHNICGECGYYNGKQYVQTTTEA
jgi:large subunit ribosomal protein L32